MKRSKTRADLVPALAWEPVPDATVMDTILAGYLEDRQWWVLMVWTPNALPLLTEIEGRHYEGPAKTGFAVLSPLNTPWGWVGLVICAKKAHMTPEQLADCLRAVGMTATFEQLEGNVLVMVGGEDLRAWMQGPDDHFRWGFHYTVGLIRLRPGEVDRSAGMLSRLVATQFAAQAECERR